MAIARDNLLTWLINRIKYRIGWKNFSHGQKQPRAIVVDLNNKQELIRLVKQVAQINAGIKSEQDKLKLRAAAGWSDHPQQQHSSKCWSGLASCMKFFSKQVTPWPEQQREAYNESFSLSEVVSGATSDNPPIIIRFGPAFQRRMSLDKNNKFVSPAGTKMRDSLDFLERHGFCFETGSMITEISNIGLASTGGHGTGFKVPSFAGLIEEFTLIDANGDQLTINEHEIIKQRFDQNGRATGARIIMDSIPSKNGALIAKQVFEQMRGANLGLFGIITQAKFRTVANYGVKEIRTVYKQAKDIFADLNPEAAFSGRLANNEEYDGFCAMGMVTDPDMPMWEVRRWQHVPLATLKNPNSRPTYDAKNAHSYFQHVETVLGSKFMQAILSINAMEVIRKLFSRLAALFAIGPTTISDKQAKPTYGQARKKEHYQVGFPKGVLLHDVSMIFPVDQTELKNVVPDIMVHAEELARKYWNEGKTPVMFAFYLRILQGTNGGLSVTSTGPNQKAVAFEFTTHPNAPGLAEFQKELVAYIEGRIGRKVRCHPGKANPVEGRNFKDIFSEETVDEFNNAVDAVNNLAGKGSNPFMTDYHAQMLGRQAMPEAKPGVAVKECCMSKDDVDEVFEEAKNNLTHCSPEFIDEQGKQDLMHVLDEQLKTAGAGVQLA